MGILIQWVSKKGRKSLIHGKNRVWHNKTYCGKKIPKDLLDHKDIVREEGNANVCLICFF